MYAAYRMPHERAGGAVKVFFVLFVRVCIGKQFCTRRSSSYIRVVHVAMFVLFASCAGVEGGIVVAKCENEDWGYGYNAANSEYGDLLTGGVLDPAKVRVLDLNIILLRCGSYM